MAPEDEEVEEVVVAMLPSGRHGMISSEGMERIDAADARPSSPCPPAPQPSREAIVRMGGGRKLKAEMVNSREGTDAGTAEEVDDAEEMGGEPSEISTGGGGTHVRVANGESAPLKEV